MPADAMQPSKPEQAPYVRDEPALAALFEPEKVAVFRARATHEHVSVLLPAEAVGVDSWARRRQAEFATGRRCARAALSSMHIEAAVPRGDQGAPTWPEGVSGSISHSRGLCVAAAAQGRPDLVIGIDIEEIARIGTKIERRILTADEQARVPRNDGLERQLFAATVFAAKEAFYKAHYQLDARYLGFDAVTVAGLEPSREPPAEPNADASRFTNLTFHSNGSQVSATIAAATSARRMVMGDYVVVAVRIGSESGSRSVRER